MAWLFLMVSALCDAFYNVFLKKVNGPTDYQNIVLVLIFLIGSVFGFKKGVDGIPMSIAMIAWSGVTIVLTILLDMVLFKAKYDYRVTFFIMLSILSIIGLSYYSNKGNS